MDMPKPMNDSHGNRRLARTIRVCCRTVVAVAATVFVWSNATTSRAATSSEISCWRLPSSSFPDLGKVK